MHNIAKLELLCGIYVKMPLVMFKAYIICAMVVHNVAKSQFLGAIYVKMPLVIFRAYLICAMVVCNVTKPQFLYAIYVKMSVVKFETFLISTKEVTPLSFFTIYLTTRKCGIFNLKKQSKRPPQLLIQLDQNVILDKSICTSPF